MVWLRYDFVSHVMNVLYWSYYIDFMNLIHEILIFLIQINKT